MSLNCIFDYKIPKVVIIRSIPFTLICRFLQFLVLLYGIPYLMIHQKGYQDHEESIISSVVLRIIGIHDTPIQQNQSLIIDGADYIVPPQEKDALFLMTNSIQADQEYKRCSEPLYAREAICTNDAQCQLNRGFRHANGKWTGRCLQENSSSIPSSQSKGGRCELEGWCPVLDDQIMPTPSHDTLNFILFIKNFIEFKRFQFRAKNMVSNASYMRQCIYDPIVHKKCPIFRIGTLLDNVEPDLAEQIRMLTYGGIIRINIDWNCNKDRSLALCLPEYSFSRLDPSRDQRSFSYGYNFRFASHWKHENRSFRTLTKAYGLRFMVSVSGHASGFNLITFIFNIGLLISVICLITFIFDIIGLHIYSRSAVDRPQQSP